MTTGADIVQTARGWKDTPFVHQGRTCGLAVDCAGLLIGVAHDLGLSEYDVDGYPRVPDGVTLTNILRSQMQEININDASIGDVLLFGFYRHAQHLGIITRVNPHYIIHAHQPNGRVIEHRLDSVWRKRVRGAFRFPGVNIG